MEGFQFFTCIFQYYDRWLKVGFTLTNTLSSKQAAICCEAALDHDNLNFFYPYYYFYFSEQVYWAKDLIFLVTEHEQLGAQAWLQAYHRTQSGAGVLNHGDLEGRAGAIQVRVSFYCKVIRVFS